VFEVHDRRARDRIVLVAQPRCACGAATEVFDDGLFEPRHQHVSGLLTALSADLNAFMRLLGRTPRSEFEPYRASIRSLADDVRAHLASAAALVAALRATRRW
jgi:hypothetical protein